MDIKVYGQPDPEDQALREAIIRFVASKGLSVMTLLCYPRKPLHARNCQRPGSLTYEFIVGDNVAYAARQERDGKITCPLQGS